MGEHLKDNQKNIQFRERESACADKKKREREKTMNDAHFFREALCIYIYIIYSK